MLAWAAWQLQYSPTAWELSENVIQNLWNKWPPHLVFVHMIRTLYTKAQDISVFELKQLNNMDILNCRLNGDMEGEVVKNVLDTNGAFNLERLKGIMDLSR